MNFSLNFFDGLYLTQDSPIKFRLYFSMLYLKFVLFFGIQFSFLLYVIGCNNQIFYSKTDFLHRSYFLLEIEKSI